MWGPCFSNPHLGLLGRCTFLWLARLAPISAVPGTWSWALSSGLPGAFASQLPAVAGGLGAPWGLTCGLVPWSSAVCSLVWGVHPGRLDECPPAFPCCFVTLLGFGAGTHSPLVLLVAPCNAMLRPSVTGYAPLPGGVIAEFRCAQRGRFCLSFLGLYSPCRPWGVWGFLPWQSPWVL